MTNRDLQPLLSLPSILRARKGGLIRATVILLLALAAPAVAGPPMICHPFEIGDATSLPWSDERVWHGISKSYPVDQLAQDTLELLQPDVPVLVRMETLRRAAIYSRQSPPAASELLRRLRSRVANAGKQSNADAMAWFDAGYFVETYKQARFLHQEQAKLVAGTDSDPTRVLAELNGYKWILQAIDIAGEDPGLQLGAAMARSQRPGHHLESALRLAKKGSLIERNIETHFPQASGHR